MVAHVARKRPVVNGRGNTPEVRRRAGQRSLCLDRPRGVRVTHAGCRTVARESHARSRRDRQRRNAHQRLSVYRTAERRRCRESEDVNANRPGRALDRRESFRASIYRGAGRI